jgi:hypothetical protein
MYESGQGVISENRKEAYRLFLALAEKNCDKSMYRLVKLIKSGFVPEEQEEEGKEKRANEEDKENKEAK